MDNKLYRWKISYEYGLYRSGEGRWIECIHDLQTALGQIYVHNYHDHPEGFNATINEVVDG